MPVNFQAFEQSEEWHRIVVHLDAMLEQHVNELIAAGEVGSAAKVNFLAGRMAMIKEIRSLPEWLYSIDRAFKGKEKEDAS